MFEQQLAVSRSEHVFYFVFWTRKMTWIQINLTIQYFVADNKTEKFYYSIFLYYF